MNLGCVSLGVIIIIVIRVAQHGMLHRAARIRRVRRVCRHQPGHILDRVTLDICGGNLDTTRGQVGLSEMGSSNAGRHRILKPALTGITRVEGEGRQLVSIRPGPTRFVIPKRTGQVPRRFGRTAEAKVGGDVFDAVGRDERRYEGWDRVLVDVLLG